MSAKSWCSVDNTKKSITMAFKSYLLLAHCNALTTTGYLLNSSLKLLYRDKYGLLIIKVTTFIKKSGKIFESNFGLLFFRVLAATGRYCPASDINS